MLNLFQHLNSKKIDTLQNIFTMIIFNVLITT